MKLFDVTRGSEPVAASLFVNIFREQLLFYFHQPLAAARMPVRCLTTGLTNEHAVAITVKAVTCLHCVTICRQDSLTPRER